MCAVFVQRTCINYIPIDLSMKSINMNRAVTQRLELLGNVARNIMGLPKNRIEYYDTVPDRVLHLSKIIKRV